MLIALPAEASVPYRLLEVSGSASALAAGLASPRGPAAGNEGVEAVLWGGRLALFSAKRCSSACLLVGSGETPHTVRRPEAGA